MPVVAEVRHSQGIIDTIIYRAQFKPLLTLLELRDAQPAPCELQARGAEGTVRHGGIRNGKRGMARSAPRRRLDRFGPGRDRDRRRRHGRRRRLHQPRLSGQGHPLRLFDPAAVDRRRHRRAVRGVFLRRTRRDVSALERRIQFPRPRLSSGLRFSGGLGVGDRRLRGAGRAGRDGVRRIRQVGRCRMRRRWRSAIGVVWLVSLVQLTGVRHSSPFN